MMKHYATKTLGLVFSLGSLLLSACAAPPRGHDATLVAQLEPVLHRLDDTGATITARVVELPTGRELYASNPDAPHLPASNMKLVSSATGLDRFGPDHVFRTYLAMDGSDLWIVGTGDPAVGDPKIASIYGRTTTTVLEEWADALRGRGVTRVSGNLYYYDGALDSEQVHPTWHKDDLVHWYACPVSGLNFNDNCVDITIFPTTDGQPSGFEVTPPVSNITVVNECVSGSEDDPTIAKTADQSIYTIGGGCTEPKALKSKPVDDPGAFFADALRTELGSRGISIDGKIVRADEPLGGKLVPPDAAIVATHETAMADIMWRIDKSSQNLFAECLCKLAGQAYDAEHGRLGPASWSSGERAIRAFLQRYGVDDNGFAFGDGSGLSRGNRVTARLITDILATMFEHDYAAEFRASLCVAGKDGTLQKRMKDITGHVFAKTGYINGVRALSGYVRTRDDRWLCFSFIYNNIPGSVKPYEALQDEACHILVDWPTPE